ncbi:MAG: YifB family Mg chelatase-like AAA ATPase [Bacillota bacterium]
MLGRTWGCTLTGLDAVPVRVECDVGPGLPGVQVVGLAGTSVKEATARVRSAVRNSGLDFPLRRITVNLAPADVHKASPGLDLPVATAILAASGQLGKRDLDSWFLAGELGLDGQVRAVAGILPMAILAARQGKGLVVPAAGARQAAAVEGLQVRTLNRLSDLVAWSRGERELPAPTLRPPEPVTVDGPDLADVRGHELPKRALLCAAAGGHHLVLVGPPGAGKTMLASCLPRLLPFLSGEESLEVSRIWSVAGLLAGDDGLVRQRPWRAPHPHLGRAAMVGGGNHPVRPGEVSLAHLGVLFLDEMNRFAGPVLESLRGPLEEGRVTLGRLGEGVTYPARFMLVAAMNPCHCGRLGDPDHPCTCTGHQVRQYWDRLSGPLLDRIDIQVEVRRMPWEEWMDAPGGPPSDQARALVVQARERQVHRLRRVGKKLNAEMGSREVNAFCRLSPEAERLLGEGFARLGLSGRGYYRLLKVARTLADLDGQARVGVEHVGQALQFRCVHFLRPGSRVGEAGGDSEIERR